jgi:isoleucyl-tRNA synthetase
LDDASNWYVRRSRRRFWKSGDDADKQDAYRTLHYILVQFAITVAPFTPFLAEELFQKLTGNELSESVHLLDWPTTGHVNELLLGDMAELRDLINQGLSQRAAAGIKVRQPLARVQLTPKRRFQSNYEAAFLDIAKEELNVKQALAGSSIEADNDMARIQLDTDITPELKQEGLAREVVRLVQNTRKQAGLNVDDRIVLVLETADAELRSAIDKHGPMIQAETLAKTLSTQTDEASYRQELQVEGKPLVVAVAKV